LSPFDIRGRRNQLTEPAIENFAAIKNVEKFPHSAVLVDFRKRHATQTRLDWSELFGSISWPLARITKPVYLVDQTPVRVVGTPFVPNTNPRQR
jgi:hypothetical protein